MDVANVLNKKSSYFFYGLSVNCITTIKKHLCINIFMGFKENSKYL